jgi:hypothetical protein
MLEEEKYGGKSSQVMGWVVKVNVGLSFKIIFQARMGACPCLIAEFDKSQKTAHETDV